MSMIKEKISKLFKKNKKVKMVDNYDKTCHLLKLTFLPSWGVQIGVCSLCGKKNFIFNHRCSNCRAKIEEC